MIAFEKRKASIWLCFFGLFVMVQGELSLDFKEAFQKSWSIGLEDAIDKAAEGKSIERSSIEDGYDDVKCFQQLNALSEGINKTQTWAIKVLDAWGKIPSGIFSGQIMDLGNFDQCLEIKQELGPSNTFVGQYCFGTVTLQLNRSIIDLTGNNENRILHSIKKDQEHELGLRMPIGSPIKLGNRLPLSFGVCGPSTCSPAMLSTFIQKAIEKIDMDIVGVAVLPGSCQKKQKIIFKDEDIVVISFYSFIAFLMILSTAYDIYCTRQKKSKQLALVAFSVHTNGAKLFSCKRNKSPDVVECLHGIRVICTFWVLYGHSHSAFSIAPLTNWTYLKTWVSEYYSMFLFTSRIAIDTFFFMSGFLMTWSILKQYQKTNGKLNYVLLYVHRYLRLTPLLAVLVFTSMTVYKYLGTGPLWMIINNKFVEGDCRGNWWVTLLYFQIFYDPSHMCFGHAWYLATDMQLFLVSPPFIYLLFRYRNKFLPVLIGLILASIGMCVGLFVYYGFSGQWLDLTGTFGKRMHRNKLTYYPPYIRMGSWIVGMIFAYMLHNLRGRRVIISKRILLLGWITSLAVLIGTFGFNYPLQQPDSDDSPLWGGMYHALTRVVWPMALAFIIFACKCGYGGPVNAFLSLPAWQPLSRLTYAIYLLHLPVILYVHAQCRTSHTFSHLNALHSAFGNLIFTVVVATVFSLAFESPIVVLEKLLFHRGNPQVAVSSTEGLNLAAKEQKLYRRSTEEDTQSSQNI